MSIKGLITSYASCVKSRKEVVFIYTWPAVLCMLIASRGIPPLFEVLKLILAVTFVGYSVYFYNDIKDLEDDLKIKELGSPAQSRRPLGSGKISKSMLKKFAIFSAIIGVLVAFAINMQVFILQLAFIVLGLLYSTNPIRLKKRFLMKQLTIMAGLMIVHLSGSLTLGVINPLILFLMLVSVLLVIGINPLVDLRDIRGDRFVGVKTIPVIWGPEMTVRLALSVVTAIGAAYAIGYYSLGLSIALPILGAIIVVSWFYVILPLLRKWDDPVYLNIVLFKKVIPLYMMTQFFVFLGALPLSFF